MASFKNDKELYMLLFKNSLKFYYYNNDKVRETFKVPNADELKYSGLTQDKFALSKDIREASFNLFFSRLKNSSIFQEDGTPYPSDSMDKIAEDFVNGKTIYFPGTGNDSYIKLSGKEMNLNEIFLECNKRRHDPPEELPVFTEMAAEPPVPAELADNSPEKPKRFGWLNSLSKFFTGKPIKSWRKYENYQKLTTINAHKQINETSKLAYNELSEENILKSKKSGYYKRAKAEAEKQGKSTENLSAENYKDEPLPDPLADTQIRWNSETKKFETNFKKNPQPVEEAKKVVKEAAPKKKVETVIKNNPVAPPEEKKEEPKYITGFSDSNARAIKAISSLIDGNSIAAPKNYLLSNKTFLDYKLKPKIAVFEESIKGLEGLAKLQEGEPKPDVNTIAGHLTNLYFLGELCDSIKTGFTVPEGEENQFSLIYQNLFVKGNPEIYNEIKNEIIESKMAENLVNDPSKINKTIFNPDKGYFKFIDNMRKITHGYLERTCSYNCELNAFNSQPKGSSSYQHPGEKSTIKSCEAAEKAEAAEAARKAAEKSKKDSMVL